MAGNLETVRAIYEAFGRGDFASSVPLYDQEIEWIETRGIPGHGSFRGMEALGDGFREWLAVWDGYSCHADELIDAGDQVVAAVTGRGRGKLSGAPTTESFFMVWKLRDGKVVRIANYRERSEALEAAGADAALR